MVSLGSALYTSTKVHFWRYFMKYFLVISVFTLLLSSCSTIIDSEYQENNFQTTREELDTNFSKSRTFMVQSPFLTEKQPNKDSGKQGETSKPSKPNHSGGRHGRHDR